MYLNASLAYKFHNHIQIKALVCKTCSQASNPKDLQEILFKAKNQASFDASRKDNFADACGQVIGAVDGPEEDKLHVDLRREVHQSARRSFRGQALLYECLRRQAKHQQTLCE